MFQKSRKLTSWGFTVVEIPLFTNGFQKTSNGWLVGWEWDFWSINSSRMPTLKTLYPPWHLEFAPENGWLEYDRFWGPAYFQVLLLLVSGRVVFWNFVCCELLFLIGVLVGVNLLLSHTWWVIGLNLHVRKTRSNFKYKTTPPNGSKQNRCCGGHQQKVDVGSC